MDQLQFKHIADGKVYDDEKPDLQEVSGIKARNPFGCRNKEQLEKKMDGAGLLDLQKMAVECNQSATGTIQSLKKKIRKAFDDFERDLGGYRIRQVNHPSLDKQREIRKLSGF